MDKSEVISVIKDAIPGALLNVTAFGNSGQTCLWVEAKSIRKVAEILKAHPKTQMTWLENISAMEVEQSLVLNYFIMNHPAQSAVVLRVSLLPTSPDAWVQIDSVTPVWKMAEFFELESSRLFGIRFKGLRASSIDPLPIDWVGFPLRKSYVYPQEYSGITHERRRAETR